MQGLRPEQNRSNLPVVRILRKKYNAAAGSIYDKNKKLRIRICRAADYNQAHPGFPDDFSIFSSGCKQTNLSTYSGCKDTHIKQMCKILLPLFSPRHSETLFPSVLCLSKRFNLSYSTSFGSRKISRNLQIKPGDACPAVSLFKISLDFAFLF